jgi:hypothetical protein
MDEMLNKALGSLVVALLVGVSGPSFASHNHAMGGSHFGGFAPMSSPAAPNHMGTGPSVASPAMPSPAFPNSTMRGLQSPGVMGGRHHHHHDFDNDGDDDDFFFFADPFFFADAFFFSDPFFYSYPYPYPYPYAYESRYVRGPEPTSDQFWNYCPDTKTYYPYVKECASPWEKVPVVPPQSPPTK